jgi:hypothetical protein
MQKISFALAMLLTFTGALTLESQQSEYDYYNLAQQDEDSLVADVEVEAEDIPDSGVFAPFVADPTADPLKPSSGGSGSWDCDEPTSGDCDACDSDIDFPWTCKCPHLQDCATVNTGTGAGSVGIDNDVTVHVDTTGTVIVPNIVATHATATNTCGLEVSNNKECGEKKKYKCFDIEGQINVCERIRTFGCTGERECSDGRFTKTSSSFTHVNGEIPPTPE